MRTTLGKAGVAGLATAAIAALVTTGVASADNRDQVTDDGLSAIGLVLNGHAIVPLEVEDDDVDQESRAVPVSGLVGDARLVGIDVRPADGMLYGLGDQGGVYVIDAITGAATPVAPLANADLTDLPLEGAFFGIDFNPVPDRLRVVSATGQNLRHNTAGTTLVDGTLGYLDAAGVKQTARKVNAAAYTNNDNDATTGTALFYLDTKKDVLATTAAPNDGVLTEVGPLGIDAQGDAGLDIHSTIEAGIATGANEAFAVITNRGKRAVYSIDLTTGAASRIGGIDYRLKLSDIAFPQGQ